MKSAKRSIKNGAKSDIDLQRLKRCKYSSTKAKLEWLESAFYFGKLKKFGKKG